MTLDLGRGVLIACAIGAGIWSLAACKSSTSPSGTPTPTPTIVTITSSGVSPKSVQIALGSRVRFVNNDAVEHDMGSDPHPDHTDCPFINSVGILKPGEQRETANSTVVRSCGYHDHEDPTNTKWQGTIVTK